MRLADIGDNIRLHYADHGDAQAPALVFANALGTDFRIWDALLPHLPEGLRIIRYDMRGHGLSSCPNGPYFMGDLVADAGALLDTLKVKECVFVGLSVGGMVAQGLAAERLDLVRGLVLSNTASKIGTSQIWQDRIAQIRTGGIEAIAFGTMLKWFSNRYRKEQPEAVEGWMNMLMRSPFEGYLGVASAIGETDLYESTARLSLPTLGIGGSEDGSTPPDLVRETVELIKGAQFELMRGVGHLPAIEKPLEYATLLTGFLRQIGHI